MGLRSHCYVWSMTPFVLYYSRGFLEDMSMFTWVAVEFIDHCPSYDLMILVLQISSWRSEKKISWRSPAMIFISGLSMGPMIPKQQKRWERKTNKWLGVELSLPGITVDKPLWWEGCLKLVEDQLYCELWPRLWRVPHGIPGGDDVIGWHGWWNVTTPIQIQISLVLNKKVAYALNLCQMSHCGTLIVTYQRTSLSGWQECHPHSGSGPLYLGQSHPATTNQR